jgi:hypothetical protein
MNEWRISPEDGYSIQTFRNNEWVDNWSQNDLPDWVWDDEDNIVVINREWFNDNYIEIKEWFTERMLLTHLSFEGTSRIIVRDITPEIKTMFTLQFK